MEDVLALFSRYSSNVVQRKMSHGEFDYLVYFEELSAEESAKVMKLTRKQTENLIFRARCALKAILEKDGYDYENL